MAKLKNNQGSAMIIAIIAIIILSGAGLVYYSSMSGTESNVAMSEDDKSMMEKNNAMEANKKADAMMDKEGDTMQEEDTTGAMIGGKSSEASYSGAVLAGSASPLLEYNKDDYEKALKSDKLVVLYFFANWCPICKVEFNNEVLPAFNSLDNEGVIGFRVNFNDKDTIDAEEGLAREFGVAYQHTKVFVKNGKRVLKSPESWKADRYIKEINNYLN